MTPNGPERDHGFIPATGPVTATMHAKLFALVATVAMLGLSAGPGVAAAADSTAANDSLDVTTSQDDGVLVTVTQNGTAAENATVDVTADGNGSYAGTGTFDADESGTVALPAPEENVTLTITASVGDRTATSTLDATVENGTNASFGQQVSAFVQSLLASGETGIGQQVSEFVRANNPGNAPDHAGPPEDAGKPDHAGPGDANETATENETEADEPVPPAHAGGNDETTGGDRGNGGGPPAHAGPGDEETEGAN